MRCFVPDCVGSHFAQTPPGLCQSRDGSVPLPNSSSPLIGTTLPYRCPFNFTVLYNAHRLPPRTVLPATTTLTTTCGYSRRSTHYPHTPACLVRHLCARLMPAAELYRLLPRHPAPPPAFTFPPGTLAAHGCRTDARARAAYTLHHTIYCLYLLYHTGLFRPH